MSSLLNEKFSSNKGKGCHSAKLGKFVLLKGLSHEIDFKNVDENGHILALLRAAAGF
jgi:hypothetical protein